MGSALAASSHLEVLPWGNLRGMRLDDSLVPVETAVRLETAGGLEQTAHYAQTASFRRLDERYEVVSQLKHGELRQLFGQTSPGRGRIDLTFTANEPVDVQSAALEFAIPLAADEPCTIIHAGGSTALAELTGPTCLGPVSAQSPVDILVGTRHYSISPADARSVTLQAVDGTSLRIAVALVNGRQMAAGDAAYLTVHFSALATPTLDPVEVAVQPDDPGATWEGIGGNFRLQFPETDPAVIDYALANLPVPWTRIAMWWSDWDPVEGESPLGDYLERDPGAKIVEQIAMAKRLVDAGNALIVSAWAPPAWAIVDGEPPPGTYGHLLDPAKMDRQVESIVAYLLMLRDRYGVNVDLFSFNEPDIGVRVVQNPQLHVTFGRALALALDKAGLSTRILAADTSNGTPYARSLAEAACADPVLRPHVAAIGFHTWGGCEPENLRAWSALARSHNLPLMITEAGADSEAHRSPDLFLDERYQFDEAALYLDISRLAQPSTIMEWQLTADYSVLDGGGTYGREGPLTPTFRYWLLWHLAQAPAGYRHIPVDFQQPEVVAAALVGADGSQVVLHVLNGGAGRALRITGLPAGCTQLVPLVSDVASGGRRGVPIAVTGGCAEFQAPGRSLITFLGNGVQHD